MNSKLENETIAQDDLTEKLSNSTEALVEETVDNVVELIEDNSIKNEICTNSTLINTIEEIQTSLEEMSDIISQANFIAINASIEAARSETQTENFSLVADQIRRQAHKTEELAKVLRKNILDLEGDALKSIAVKFSQIANNTIERIEAFVFNRINNIRSWKNIKVFSELVQSNNNNHNEAVSISQNVSSEYDQLLTRSSNKIKMLLKNHENFDKIFIANKKGEVILCTDEKYIKKEVSSLCFFIKTINENTSKITDVYKNPLTDNIAQIYSAPIRDKERNPIGVIFGEIEVKHVNNILKSIFKPSKSTSKIISKCGDIVASSDDKGIVIDNLVWLRSAELALDGNTGYSIESARNGQMNAWGFAHSYNQYEFESHNWSALISVPLKMKSTKFISEIVSRDPEGKKSISESVNSNLEKVAQEISKQVHSINTINNESNMLAVNASIQAGVAGHEGEAFSIIAKEIGMLSKKTENFVTNINNLTEKLANQVEQTIFQKLYETIDKLDDFIIERALDIKTFAKTSNLHNFLTVKDENLTNEGDFCLQEFRVLSELFKDLLLIDIKGEVRSTALYKDVIGNNYSFEPWFKQCLQGKQVITELISLDNSQDLNMYIASPVYDSNKHCVGVCVGVISGQDLSLILKEANISSQTNIYLCDSSGKPILQHENSSYSKFNASVLSAFKKLNTESCGFIVRTEKDYNNEKFAYGYSSSQNKKSPFKDKFSIWLKQPLSK